MGRTSVIVGVVFMSSIASAEPREPPVQFEVGLNTRHFTSAADDQSAFRGEMDTSAYDAQSAVTMGLRFTRWLPMHMVAGIEGEIGRMPAYSGSNLAGAYGIFGARFDMGSAELSAEMAGGVRSVRYNLEMGDERKIVFEPRVRAQIWAGPRMTVGAAVGATLEDRTVWMAGVYIGVHSLVYGRTTP